VPWPKNKPRSPETRERLRVAFTGRTRPDSVKAKISAAKKGKRPSIQVRVKLSLIAMQDGRVERLHEKRRTDPEWAARQSRESSERLRAWHARRKSTALTA
jgi:hypothetical protein